MKQNQIMYGGVVNKIPGSSNFESVVKMLMHPRCKIKSISYSSLKGFIFVLHVPNLEPNTVEFYGLNETTNKFDVPVDTLILKFSILFDGDRDSEDLKLNMDEYVETIFNREEGAQKFFKEMDIYDDFFQEAVLQSEIYEKSLSRGEPLCPALIDVSFFSEEASAMQFLDALAHKCLFENESAYMIEYLKGQLTKGLNRRLGMITMESAADHETFQDAFKNSDEETQRQLCQMAIYKSIRLLNECKTVHCDEHDKNILVKRLPDGTLKGVIIDFGSAINVNKMLKALNVEVKDQFPQSVNLDREYSKLLTRFSPEDVDKLLQFMINVEIRYSYFFLKRRDDSKIRDYYLDPLGENPGYNFIANLLNSYYLRSVTCDSHSYEAIKEGALEEKTRDVPPPLCETNPTYKPIYRNVARLTVNPRRDLRNAGTRPSKKLRIIEGKSEFVGGKKTRKQRKKRTRKLHRRKTSIT